MSETQDLTSLDAIFDLPETLFSDPKLRQVYEVLIHRMKDEAKGCPSESSQILLMERAATTYVTLKQWEKDGKFSPSQHKTYSEFFLSLMGEFNRSLKKKTPEQTRIEVLNEVKDIIVGTVGKIKDPKLREVLSAKFLEAFETAGV